MAMDTEGWAVLAAARPELFAPENAAPLVELATNALSRAPWSALVLSKVATWVVGFSADESEVATLVRGDAWRVHGSALSDVGDLDDALAAVSRADTFYAGVAGEHPGSVLAALVRGRIRYFQGHCEEALEIVGEASEQLLHKHREPAHYVKARTMYAGFLLALQRYKEAEDVYRSIANIAEELNNDALSAFILQNVGMCNLHLGYVDEAKQCFEGALEMFTTLGLKADAPRPRGGLALVLIKQGKYGQATLELNQNRTAYLELGMALDAAKVALRIVEVAFLAGRTSRVPALCAEMLKTFTAAKLHREVLKVLSYLNYLAKHDRANAHHVLTAIDFVDRLQAQPDLVFLIPE
jgi:tetratricopeptide (TPR) repeat protein